jgi:hypothetical protein
MIYINFIIIDIIFECYQNNKSHNNIDNMKHDIINSNICLICNHHKFVKISSLTNISLKK